MTPPGDRLRRFVSRVCSDESMRRLVDPVIADLQFEYADAKRRGHRWRARIVHIRGVAAFAAVVARSVDAPTTGARLVMSALGIAAVALPFLLIELQHVIGRASRDDLVRLALMLLPSALVAAIPIGLSAVMSITRRPSRRLAVVGSLALLLQLAWIVPESDQVSRAVLSPRHAEAGLLDPAAQEP